MGVNVGWDKENAARKFVEKREVPYAVGHDTGNRIGSLYRVDATPITFVIYADGSIAAIARGRMEFESLTAVLEQLTDNKKK